MLDSEARVNTTSERTVFESLPPNADAEASMFTIATKMADEAASAKIFGTR